MENELRLCKKCNHKKCIDDFYNHRHTCVKCLNIIDCARAKARYSNDPEHRKSLLLKNSERTKSRRKSDPEYKKAQNDKSAARYSDDPEYRKEHIVNSSKRAKVRYQTDPEYRKTRVAYSAAYRSKRLREDPIFRLKDGIRNLIRTSYRRRGFKKNLKSVDILGCDHNTFIEHLKQTAIIRYGHWCDSEVYEIDHIVALLNAGTVEEVTKLNHHSNLQLLTVEDHRIKTINDIRSLYE